MKTVLFNPYTGTPRHPSDIQSDPQGLALIDDTEPLRAFREKNLADRLTAAMKELNALKQAAALQAMVDDAQKMGLYDTPTE